MDDNPYQAPRANQILPEQNARDLHDWVDAPLGRRWLAYTIDQLIMVGVAIGLMIIVELTVNSAMDASLLDAIPEYEWNPYADGAAFRIHGLIEHIARLPEFLLS